MRRWMYALGAPALVGGLVVTAPIAASSAATFQVPETNDDAADPETLRGAVVEANGNDEADTLVLTAGATYTLTIGGAGEDAAATGDLDITTDITIEGNGATIDASALGDRAFHVLAGGSLTLLDVRITGGTAADPASAAGGGSGGAVLNAGTLVAEGSTFSGNDALRAGGAVEASAGSTTTLTGTDLTDNSTGPEPGNGGGLHLTGAGTVTVDGGTVSGNTASAEGGGLWNSGAGTMSITDVTVTGNTASGADATQGGGGVFAEAGPDGVTTITGGTISDNVADGAAGSGGGVLNDQATVVVEGTTISGNTAVRAGGGVEANIGSTTLTDVTLDANETGDAPGNGGGLHVTGAGEAVVTGSTVTDNTASLEGGGLWNGTGTMTVTDTVVSGNTASGAAADDGGGGLFNNGGTLVVTGSEVTGNSADGAAGSGGGILTLAGTLTVTDSSVDGNDATRAGGGVEATEGSTTTLTGGTLWQNETGAAPGNGGGLHLTGEGTVEIDDMTVADNTASAEGGGLWNSAAGTMTVTGSVVSGNTASGADADQGGGGLFNDGGSLTVTGTTVDANTADGAAGSGGGLLTNGGTLVVSSSDVTDNTAVRAGGGIEATVDGSVTEVSDVLLAGNSTGDAPGNGGGLHLTGAGTVSVTGSTVAENSATNEGGGLWNSGGGTMTVSDTTLVGNSTDGDGGGLHNDGGALEVVDSTVSGNTAAGLGGGVNAGGETPAAAEDVTLVHVTVTDNSSGVAAALTIGNSVVAGNSDDDGTDEVVSLGGNVTGSGIDGGSDDVTDVTDPGLGDLADNGGPTETHLPAAGSPAVDAGVADLGDDTDQRGEARPVDGGTGVVAPDAGSVEVAADGGDNGGGAGGGNGGGNGGGDDGRAGNDGGMAPAAPARPTGAQPSFTG